jgi:hypothetical protein
MAYVANLEAVSADGNWTETFYLFDQQNGGMINLSGWTFAMSFRSEGNRRSDYDFSGSSAPYQATSAAGNINYIGNGAFVVTYPLRHGVYNVVLELTRTIDGYVCPIMTGTLAIQRGLSWQ